MSPSFTRRSALRTLLAASAGSALPASRLLASPLRPSSSSPLTPIRESILRATRSGEVAGVAVAVAQAGRVVWEEGFGFSNREQHRPATARTPFCLASISKPFTATLLTTLAAQQRLHLDDPGNHYLAGAPITGPNGAPDAATVRRLGAHISGLPGMFVASLASNPAPRPSDIAILHDFGRLSYPPGEVYEYSNIGFSALGAIASGLTGQPLPALMRQRVLAPLGLHDSFFGMGSPRVRSAATLYDNDGHPIPAYVTATAPSGEIYSSAHDLLRFALWNLRLPVPGQHPILTPSWLDELHAPVFTGPTGVSTTFGWFRGKTPSGTPFLFKGGGQPGVASKLYMVPSHGLACLVLTNQTSATAFANSTCSSILRTVLPDWHEPEEDAGPPSIPWQPTADLLGDWVGTVSDAGVRQPLRLAVRPHGITITLGHDPAVPLTDLHTQAPGAEGFCEGTLDTPAAVFGRRTLVVKVVPHAGRLVGRITARGTRPGLLLANISYSLSLDRA